MTRIIAWLTGLAVVIGGIWYASHLIQRETADTRGQTRVVEQISADADYRIGAYESFYNRCHAVKAKEGEIALAEEALAGTGTDSWNYSQLERNLLALKNSRIQLIEAYNADASKEDTAANFLASDLPHQLDTKEKTECSA